MVTVKNHKPYGAMALRNIHSAAGSRLAGLSTWVAKEVQRSLAGFGHLLKGAEQLVDDLRLLRVSPNARMIRMDVKDFYMSGSKFLLSTSAGEIVGDGSRSTLVGEATRFLLDHDFAASPLHRSRLWRVVRGSGMGRTH